MARNLSESELNPNVLTNSGSGSEEHGQVAGKPDLSCRPRRVMQTDGAFP